MELTVNQVREKLFNKEMLGLLVQDYEMGMAYDEEHNGFFELSDEEKADRIAKHINNHLDVALYNNVLAIVKEDK